MKKELIKWRETLSIDGGIVDEQHKVLIKLINELYNAFIEGKAKETSAKIIEGLIEYTVFHFDMEEVFFEAVAYPEIVAHKAAHKAFVDKIEDFKTKLATGNVTLSYDVMNFLRDWLQKHILGTDKQYVPYLENYNFPK